MKWGFVSDPVEMFALTSVHLKSLSPSCYSLILTGNKLHKETTNTLCSRHFCVDELTI